MPIYEYECLQCNHMFEEIQKIGEGGEDLVCPVCKAPQPERVLSCCNSVRRSEGLSFDSSPPPSSCGSSGFS